MSYRSTANLLHKCESGRMDYLAVDDARNLYKIDIMR